MYVRLTSPPSEQICSAEGEVRFCCGNQIRFGAETVEHKGLKLIPSSEEIPKIWRASFSGSIFTSCGSSLAATSSIESSRFLSGKCAKNRNIQTRSDSIALQFNHPVLPLLAHSLAQRLANGAEFGAMKAAKSGTKSSYKATQRDVDRSTYRKNEKSI